MIVIFFDCNIFDCNIFYCNFFGFFFLIFVMYAWFDKKNDIKSLTEDNQPRFRIYCNGYLFTICRVYCNAAGNMTHYYRCRSRYFSKADNLCDAKCTIKWNGNNTLQSIIFQGIHTNKCCKDTFIPPYSLFKHYITDTTTIQVCEDNEYEIVELDHKQDTANIIDNCKQKNCAKMFEYTDKLFLSLNNEIYKFIDSKHTRLWRCINLKCRCYCLMNEDSSIIQIRGVHNHDLFEVVTNNWKMIQTLGDVQVITSCHPRRQLRLDSDIQFVPSIHEKQHMLAYNKYLYIFNRSAISAREPRREVHYYCCYEKMRGSHCNASIIIYFESDKNSVDNEPIEISIRDFHFCVKMQNYDEILQHRIHLSNLKCELPDRTNIKNMYQEYVNRLILKNNAEIKVPSFQKIYRSLWFHQRKNGLKIPLEIENFVTIITEQFNKHLNGNEWVCDTYENNIVLCSQNGISRLNGCDFIAVDGNHKAVCKFGNHKFLHVQLIIISAVYVGQNGNCCEGFASAYILCESHKMDAYTHCFSIINSKLNNKKFVSALCDYERAFLISLVKSKLVCYVYGCLFHMNQAIQRKFPSVFRKLYTYNFKKNDASFRQCMEILWILPFVPQNKMKYAYKVFTDDLKILCSDLHLENEYNKFEKYLRRTWYGSESRININIWCCSERLLYKYNQTKGPCIIIPETSNNKLEATNGYFNKTIGVKKNCLVWIENLCYIENQMHLKYEHAMRKFPTNLKQIPKKTINKEKRLVFWIKQIDSIKIKINDNGDANDDDLDELNDILKEMSITRIRQLKQFAKIKYKYHACYR